MDFIQAVWTLGVEHATAARETTSLGKYPCRPLGKPQAPMTRLARLLSVKMKRAVLPNGSRLSCGRNARRRKAVERQKKKLAGEATQFFPHERPPASSAC